MSLSLSRECNPKLGQLRQTLFQLYPTQTCTMKICVLLMTILSLVVARGNAFVASPSVGGRSTTDLSMGLFDGIMKAFANEEFASPPEGISASARHILVKSPEEVDVVMEQLKGGANFATVAAEYSTCPSGKQGGCLGSFRPGTMVQEFDSVIFDPNTELGQIVGPVETKFGYHMIVVDKRTGV